MRFALTLFSVATALCAAACSSSSSDADTDTGSRSVDGADDDDSPGASSSSGSSGKPGGGNAGPIEPRFEASATFLGTHVADDTTYYVLDGAIATKADDGTLATLVRSVGRPAFTGDAVVYVALGGGATSVCRAALADGAADAGFGEAGCTELPLSARAKGVVGLPDGGTLALLNTDDDKGFAVVRLDESGAVDASFGDAGVAYPNPGEDAEIESFAQQSDGSVVASITVQGYTLRLVRIATDGTWDRSFGTDGSAVSPGAGDAITVLGDDSIVLGGQWNGIYDIEHWTKDGAADEAFGDGGRVEVDLVQAGSNEDAQSQIEAVLGDAEGRLYVAGQEVDNLGSVYGVWKRPFVARLTSTGTLDSSFGKKGVVSTFAGVAEMSQTVATGLGLDHAGHVVFGMRTDAGTSSKLYELAP